MKNEPKIAMFLRSPLYVFIKNIFFAFLLIASTNANAQNREFSLKPFLGIGIYKTQDQVISPLIYRGTSTLIGIEQIKQTAKTLSNFKIMYGTGKLKNDFKNTATNHTGEIYFSLMKPIAKHFFVGGASQTFVAVRDYSVAKAFGLESLSGDIFSTVKLAFAHQTEKKKWGKIQTKIEFAMIGVAISRKMYNIVSNPDLIVLDEKVWKTVLKSAEVMSVSQLKKADFNLKYTKNISARQSIGLDLGMSFYRYERLNAATISQNSSATLGYTIHFKH